MSSAADYQSPSSPGGTQSTSSAADHQSPSIPGGTQSTLSAADHRSPSSPGGTQSTSSAADHQSSSACTDTQLSSTLTTSVTDGGGTAMSTAKAGPEDGSAVTATLTMKDTHKVYEAMFDARDKWRSIGGIFHLSPSTLINIDADNKNNEDKLYKVIIEWLKRGESCSWSQIVMALRNKTVSREDLAQEVLQLHPQPGLQCATVPSGSASSLPDNAQTTAVSRKPTTSLSPRGKFIYIYTQKKTSSLLSFLHHPYMWPFSICYTITIRPQFALAPKRSCLQRRLFIARLPR